MTTIVQEYNTYTRNKISYYKLYGVIISPKTLEELWKSIALDFIVKLLLSKT